MTIDQDKLGELLGRFVGDLGATIAAGNVVVGHRLGLYRSLAEGPATAEELARRTGTDPRYIAEWLRGQAAGGYVSCDPAAGRFSLTEEQAFALADPDGTLYLPGAFLLALGALRAESQVTDAFRSGAGMGWHEHHEDVFAGTEMFFRPGYVANLTSSWIPALDGVAEKLAAGGRVADVGCGHGASTVLLAQAYPTSAILGSDYHQASVDTARKHAAEAGLADRARFEVASAQTFSGTGYDLVATFDCLHDMGDPVGAARQVHRSLAPEGTWMIVEPAAGDRVEDNLNPVGRAYYGFSTLLCTPASLSQEVGLALGAQAGEARIRDVVTSGGFTRFRRAAETPFNLVFEARP
jgi:2-polyprenyl-3-methyl-5-hydroxy-6-metoxy-1,4-benzoquinol methylase